MKLEKKPHPPLSSPRNDAIPTTEQQFASKPAKKQANKEVNLQTSKETNQQTTVLANQQNPQEVRKLFNRGEYQTTKTNCF